jgi:3-mercaptopyruvate sulfurtransferase SseA
MSVGLRRLNLSAGVSFHNCTAVNSTDTVALDFKKQASVQVALYDGSWMEWATTEGNTIFTD